MVKAQLIEADDGEQIVVFPPGFVIDADEVELVREGDWVLLNPVTRQSASPSS